MLGSVLGNDELWKHGALMEMGFEIMDLLANVRGVWPYTKDHVDPDVRVALAFHHLPGLMTIVPIILYGLNSNPSLQRLGAWLLFAAAASCLAAVFVYTRNFNDPYEMKQAALTHSAGVALFFYARFAVFPFEMYTFYQTYQNRHDIHEYFPSSLYYGGHFLNFFNVVVGLKVAEKSIRYLRKAFFNQNINVNDNQKALKAKAAAGKSN